jgi:APA family basic amino acid/polyamine antiporter
MSQPSTVETSGGVVDRAAGFARELGLLDSTMIVAGSMIGSGIFIVSADIGRQVGSTGWLLATWVITGLLTIAGALSYGELAAMMPRAGGQYVYLREAFSPLWGFLYGWALLLVIQSGTIAAVAVGFARYLGVLLPAVSPTHWIVRPIDLSTHYAISLSTQQLVGILMVVFLTALNTRGIRVGKLIQNVFTSAKTLSLVLLIVVGVLLGRNAAAMASNFSHMWTPVDPATIHADYHFLPDLSAAAGILGLFVALAVSQVGSLFSSDAWNNITFTAGEVKEPRKNIPLALFYGTALVITLYLLANVAYLCTLTLEQIKTAPDDRVATAALSLVFGNAGAMIMAVAIIISTFGCNNGLILAGARVYYAMAQDGLFFRKTGELNARRVPSFALVVQCIVTCVIILPRTRTLDRATGAPVLDPTTHEATYGNLYGQLLDWVIFAVLLFYVLTILGLFVLRRTRPDAERPYRAFGYPLVPGLYIVAASAIALVLLFYRTKTSLPGLGIVLTGVPVYLLWRRSARAQESR